MFGGILFPSLHIEIRFQFDGQSQVASQLDQLCWNLCTACDPRAVDVQWSLIAERQLHGLVQMLFKM
jgi:hypothetical protein